ncbi:ephrin type-A receptor 2-like [Mercenaria mercenaria]|uniref:ephrin type-A receptor 2-like n=1 Tax=Mercenaria mercenaria TaxID=6596 RepID=UPI00234EF1E1|nr:ephrin type-A receptor 2-like [Mercenaria mercenaria]XP_053406436.1 ephrin type-A receptor 2-like [Mercenaria mercenaria]XP_053406443.1 ephrin type-A receptor 2-like [Mercenaria mercenaria]XP_053406449.1 ephrin type-A receptor 2-like [Mercenaria mercenaria]
MARKNISTNVAFLLDCIIFIILNLTTSINSSKTGVIPVARCRSRCLAKFLKDTVDDEECQMSDACFSCWGVCEEIFSMPDVWREPCRRRKICKVGCQTACQFRKYVSRSKSEVSDSSLSRSFTEIPAVSIEKKMMREAIVAWSTPIVNNIVPGTKQGSNLNFVYVLFARDKNKKAGSAWKQIVQTSSTYAIMDLTSLPYYPEFWLMAVGENGTQAAIRFNASISDEVPYTEDVIIVPDRSPHRINEGATIEYNKDSTLKLNMTMTIVDGVLYPTVSWLNPSIVPKKGNQLAYAINYFLQYCDCPWPPDHYSKMLYVQTYEQPKLHLENIAFNAEYLVEIELKSDKNWSGQVTFFTPECLQPDRPDHAKCLSEVSGSHDVVYKTTTPFPKTTLETLINDTVALDTGHLKQHGSPFGAFSSYGLDWNITNAGIEYDVTNEKILLHLKWSLPFNHTKVSQEIVWNNIRHVDHVDAGRLKHVSKTEANSKTLQLRPFSQYKIYVQALYTDDNGNQNELRSRVLEVNTNITDQTPQVSLARISAIDQEKDILNGIILGVTVVSSVIIFGIIILFIYKKRQSFRDIIITKTTVAKSNSYKSNVGCKVDYSNQILITSDDWEVDCRQLKFASHIGQGAFGKVVTGYYQDQRVAIKLVRDCAPISYKEDLLAEIALMKRLGSHPNIVSMVGACTLVEPICLVMEYVPYGNLQNFLKKCRLEGELTVEAGRSPELNYSLMDEHGGINEGVIKPADLLSFARQVAMAMEYLGDKKYVHRDLAARNVLLGFDKIIKVCDFGLSRDIFNDNQYKKLTNGKLPLKWMAVESLRDRVFTTQSDVWSFGILLWEIVTMGASPYPNIALADLYYLLSNNYRMEKPSNCSDEIYIIMRQCWLENPADRPNFTDLRVQLELLLTRDRNYLDLDNINVPLSTPESSSGSPASDDTKSLLAAQALQPQRKSSKDELTVNVSIHDKSVERLLKRKGDFDTHNITIL